MKIRLTNTRCLLLMLCIISPLCTAQPEPEKPTNFPDVHFELEMGLQLKDIALQERINKWKESSPSRKYLLSKALLADATYNSNEKQTYAKNFQKQYELAEELIGTKIDRPSSGINKIEKKAYVKSQTLKIKDEVTKKVTGKKILTPQERNALIGPEPIIHGQKKDIERQGARFAKLLDYWFPVGRPISELTTLLGSAPQKTRDNEYMVDFDSGFGGLYYTFTVSGDTISDFDVGTSD